MKNTLQKGIKEMPSQAASSQATRKNGGVSKAKQKSKNHYTTVEMAPCKVCGGKSTGYHFGAVTCEACKAFFRRALNKTTPDWTCANDEDCGRNLKRISGCSACRLKRCIEVGMSRTGIRSGRFSVQLRTQSILDAKQEQEKRALRNDVQVSSKNTAGSEPDPVKHVDRTRKRDSQIPKTNVSSKTDYEHIDLTRKRDADSESLDNCASTIAKRTRYNDKKREHQHSANNSETSKSCPFTSRHYWTRQLSNPSSSSSGSPPSCSDVTSGEQKTGSISSPDSLQTYESQPSSVNSGNVPVTGSSPRQAAPLVAADEESHICDVIQRLVMLKGMLYPHHKANEHIVQRQKRIAEEHRKREEAFETLFGKSADYVSSAEFKEVLSEINIELDDRLQHFEEKAIGTERNIVLYVHHCKAIPGFRELDQDDVARLLKASYMEFWLFSNYATMNSQTNVSGGTDGAFNAHKKVTSSFFPREFVDQVFQYGDTLTQMDLTLEEIAIIRVIILTFTDRCPLKHPEKVSDLQHLFIRCLLYQLSKTSADPTQRFGRIMGRLTSIRDLTHKNASVNEQFLRDWGFLMTDYPLWREMMMAQSKQ